MKIMTIEKLKTSDIEKMDDSALRALRNQFDQIHNKYWTSWPGISKEEFIQKYDCLATAIDSRDIPASTAPIDISLCGYKMQRIASGQSLDSVDSAGTPADLSDPLRAESREFHKMIVKKDDSEEPERIVFGIVAEPNEEDTQGDWESAEDIQKALYNFMEGGAIFKMNHKGSAVDAHLLEAFIAPVDYEIEGEAVKKGSWVQALRVDADTFSKIEDGTLTGFSMAGTAIRIEDTVN